LATKSLLARAQELALWDRNPIIGARLASIPATYASFCESTQRQLSLARETHLKNALSGSILLAERHLLGSIDTITPFIPLSPGPPRYFPTVPLRLYTVQKEELEAAETLEYPNDPEELAQHSPAAISSDDVSLMLHLIHHVNETARLNGREDVFTPTNKMFEAVIDLNGIVPTNKLVFGHFMDCLYWIFYEGAGKDNLRFHTKQGGPLSDDDCAVIWDIKTLRNKLCRHDPEHGDKSSVKRSYRSLSETLARLGLRQVPHNSDHYRMLHRLLIERLVDFLSGLLQKLTPPSS